MASVSILTMVEMIWVWTRVGKPHKCEDFRGFQLGATICALGTLLLQRVFSLNLLFFFFVFLEVTFCNWTVRWIQNAKTDVSLSYCCYFCGIPPVVVLLSSRIEIWIEVGYVKKITRRNSCIWCARSGNCLEITCWNSHDVVRWTSVRNCVLAPRAPRSPDFGMIRKVQTISALADASVKSITMKFLATGPQHPGSMHRSIKCVPDAFSWRVSVHVGHVPCTHDQAQHYAVIISTVSRHSASGSFKFCCNIMISDRVETSWVEPPNPVTFNRDQNRLLTNKRPWHYMFRLLSTSLRLNVTVIVYLYNCCVLISSWDVKLGSIYPPRCVFRD